MSDNEPGSKAPGLHIHDNISINNRGDGISVPASMVGRISGNYTAGNGRDGIVVRGEYEDLLAAMRLRSDTSPEVLAKALSILKERSCVDEDEAKQVVERSGLLPQILQRVLSFVDFIANLLSIVNSPQGLLVLARVLS